MKTEFLNTYLEKLERDGLKRHLKELSGPQGAHVILDGKQVVNFCSNNYLGLASDKRLLQAAANSLAQEGMGSGASRLVCGNLKRHRALEKKIAAFKGTEDCLVFSTGYMANVGIISSLCERGDIILSDKLNHASIVDGIRLSRAEFRRYPHKNMNALEEELKKAEHFQERFIVTDSVFSMDGDIAPLDKIVELAQKYKAFVMVDEAHSFGVLGKNGKGAVEHFGLQDKIDIQMGTLSKAAGSFGAYCCGSKNLVDFLINKARSFIYTTGMPACVAAASLKAVEIIEKEPQRRQDLLDNAHNVRQAFQEVGFDILQSQTPIIPVVVSETSKAVEFSKQLFEKNIFVQAIRPPTVPENTARLRVTVMATHNQEDIAKLLSAFEEIGKKLCLI
ncbi:MAG: 8-amino-7-oxononanoate synthase [Candidatus Aceula meridiana]|nr:8-amino-7-oxononanoate synthase [Candidatus Aceula meridiana]